MGCPRRWPLDESLLVVCEMNQQSWDRLANALIDMEPEEIDWRPVPEANSINAIVRHLRIEAEWHRDSLQLGAPMPTVATSVLQEAVDAVPLDFGQNRAVLESAVAGFLATLRATSL